MAALDPLDSLRLLYVGIASNLWRRIISTHLEQHIQRTTDSLVGYIRDHDFERR